MSKGDRIRLAAVSPRYRPGYPSRLSADEFRALLASGRTLRLRRCASLLGGLALAACSGSGGSGAPGPRPLSERPQAPQDLEARVLALLNRVSETMTEQFWFDRSTFERAGASRVVANVPICFGNSINGVFDVQNARRFAVELFRAYGIELEADVALKSDGVEAEIDGFDRASRLGFELRELPPDGKSTGVVAWAGTGTLRVEPEKAWLSDAEQAALEKEGTRIAAADPQGLYDGDGFTPTAAYLLGLADFLNGVTDGPEFDIGHFLAAEKQVFTLAAPSPAAPALKGRKPADLREGFDLGSATTLRFDLVPGPGLQIESEAPGAPRGTVETPLERALPTAGRPTVISIGASCEGKAAKVRVTQAAAGDAAAVDVAARAGNVFLPSRFDATRAFRIEIDFEPGRCTLSDRVAIRTLRAPR